MLYNIISVLNSDFYKQCHPEQYDKRITKLVSYDTPRMTRIRGIDAVPVIGQQIYIQERLIEDWNTNFFCRPLNDIIEEYHWIIGETMGENRVHLDKIVALHNLSYLPIEIRMLEEGTMCPIRVPMMEISNTHDNFAWVVNCIETDFSAETWYYAISATVGMMYRKIVNKYYELTSDNPHLAKSAISEFGYRGLHGRSGAIKASTGFLASFNKTATIPAIVEIHAAYGDELKTIGGGMASTEHSVMCSSYAIDGDEITLIRRLLTEVYPDGNFSMVCDSYDYWNVVKNIIPQLKEEILHRDGTLYVRGDSGNPVEILTETVYALWDIFGGTTNSKGYKVLDSHIRAIYGEAITPLRAEKIYENLMHRGFSAENVALGAGSFSMLCLEEAVTYTCMACDAKEDTTRFNIFNRDTFGRAIKTTYGEYDEGGKWPIEIFKDPKTDTGNFKKSQKGACAVVEDPHTGIISYQDGMTLNQAHSAVLGNMLRTVFKDGQLINPTTFTQIRNKLWNNKF